MWTNSTASQFSASPTKGDIQHPQTTGAPTETSDKTWRLFCLIKSQLFHWNLGFLAILIFNLFFGVSWGGRFCISLMRSFSRINPDSHYCGSCFAKASWRRADSCKWAVFHRSFCIHRCYICLIVGRILNILQYSYGNCKLAWLTFILLIYLSFYILIVLTWWKPVSVISRAHVNIAGRITHFQNLGQWPIYLSNVQIHNYSSKTDVFFVCFVFC